jgi:hypothetical protein
LNLSPPIIQDDAWFLFWLDLIGLVRSCYDFKNNKWIHLPFSGGFMEQADQNPFLWAAICRIVQKEYEKGE